MYLHYRTCWLVPTCYRDAVWLEPQHTSLCPFLCACACAFIVFMLASAHAYVHGPHPCVSSCMLASAHACVSWMLQLSMDDPDGNIVAVVAENKLSTNLLLQRLVRLALLVLEFIPACKFTVAQRWLQERMSKCTPIPPDVMVYPSSYSGQMNLRKAFASMLEATFMQVRSAHAISAALSPVECCVGRTIEIPVSAENIIVQAGAGALLDNLFWVLGEPGQGILVPAPYYPQVRRPTTYVKAWNSCATMALKVLHAWISSDRLLLVCTRCKLTASFDKDLTVKCEMVPLPFVLDESGGADGVTQQLSAAAADAEARGVTVLVSTSLQNAAGSRPGRH
eukprot:355515-Chlamydomonas_euryale.AAC.20